MKKQQKVKITQRKMIEIVPLLLEEGLYDQLVFFFSEFRPIDMFFIESDE